MKNGTTEVGTAKATQCGDDLNTCYNAAYGLNCDVLFSSVITGTLKAGVYCGYSSLSIAAYDTIYLDAANTPTARWVFAINVDLTLGVHSSVLLKNGALSSNVFWNTGGSVILLSYTTIVGNILSSNTLYVSNAVLIGGRAFGGNSLIFAGSTRITPSSYVSNVVNVTVGSCASFTIHARIRVIFKTIQTVINEGNIGVSPGVFITGSYVQNSGNAQLNSTLANACAIDSLVGYNAAVTATCLNRVTGSTMAGTYKSGMG